MTAKRKNWRKESKNTYPLYLSQDSSFLLVSPFSPARNNSLQQFPISHEVCVCPLQGQPSCSQQELFFSICPIPSHPEGTTQSKAKMHPSPSYSLREFHKYMTYSICTVSNEQIWKTILPSVTKGFTR